MSTGKIIILAIVFIGIGLFIGIMMKPLAAGDIVQNPVTPVTYTSSPTGGTIYQWNHNVKGEIDEVIIHDAKSATRKVMKLNKIY